MVKLIQNGGITAWLRWALVIGGAVIVFLGISYLDSIVIMSIGLLMAAVGGYSSRAKMLGLKPFGESSWRKAKKTYEENDSGGEDK
jgi:hypothetical protein